LAGYLEFCCSGTAGGGTAVKRPIGNAKLHVFNLVVLSVALIVVISLRAWGDPSDTDHLKQGNVYREMGKCDRAISEYTEAIGQNPKGAEAYYNRALSYGMVFQHDQAIADFDKAIELNPNEARYYISRGSAYGYKRQYDQAIANYNKAIKLNPSEAQHYAIRAHAYREKRQYDQAIADYNKAIELNPNYKRLYQERARIYFYKQEYDKAWEDVHRAESLGWAVYPPFLDRLRNASGRER
jgi:tetratricopeptide (TPR) repeat protein